MEELNNPAGRLHTLLSKFEDASDSSVSVLTAWSRVLGTEDHQDTYVAVSRVAGLLPEIERTLAAMGSQRQLDAYHHYCSAWSRPIFSPDRPWTNGSHDLVDPGAMVTLGAISGFLSATSPEGVIPDETRREDLRGQLLEALDVVRKDTDLPQSVKVVMVRRLHDMLWAIDHLDVEGPGGAKDAAEALLATYGLQPEGIREKINRLGVLKVAGAVWMAFTAGGEVPDAIEAWSSVAGFITGG